MKELLLRGHRPGDVYPSTAVDVDVAGSAIVPRPSAQLLFASPVGSVLGAYHDAPTGKYLMVTRSGTTNYLYLRSGTTNVQLASWTEAVADGVISFVPLADRVVVVCRSRIFLVDTTGDTAIQVTKPSAPSGVTATAKQEYITLSGSLASQSDRATVTYNAPYFTVDDNTTDNIAGAYQQLYASGQVDVSHCDDAWLRVESYDTELLSPSTVSPIQDTRTGNQDFYAGLPTDVKVRGWVQMPLTQAKLIGVHFFVQMGSVTVHERLYFTPRTRPEKYRVVSVQNGFESDYQEVTVSINTLNCPTPGGYVVDFTNLPSGTWRIYRQDSAGDWRLVAEGTGSTYTDRKREEELGEKWFEPVYPYAGGIGAVGWQNRIVLNDGAGKLYISQPGEYAWRDDSDILQLPSRLLGMATIGGRLYLNHSGAWWELIGSPGAWMQRTVLPGTCPKPALGIYQSNSALVAEGRLYLPIAGQWTEVDLQDTHLWATDVYQGMAASGTSCVYVLQRGRWVKWNENALAIWYTNQRYEIAKSDGVYALNGSRVSTGQILETVPMLQRVNTVRIYVDGVGSINASLNGSTPETWTLPFYRDRWRVEDWEWALTLSLSSNAQIRRILIDAEVSSSYG
ncbi:MAG: hypothetical protein KatS3mg023_0597 [Armatimonadota bacterium]|nr:MAG: hypothetical protein KatS3mg023_0597 [Armatimonadota bacterium]